MNVKLLKAVRDMVLARPKQFDMDDLFNSGYWPARYLDAYHKAPSLAARAKVAAKRINAFIRSKGAR